MGYPSARELEMVKRWPIGDPLGWVEFIDGLWTYRDYSRRTQRRWHLSTGGWSGNEDIVAAMRSSLLWCYGFASHRRGGHYVFDLTRLRQLQGVQ